MEEYTKEELIEILIAVDREDLEANDKDGTMGSMFSEELHRKIGMAILPTLQEKHKALSITQRILKETKSF